jgi:DNA-binding Lrp family transcriptional regulator
LHFSVIYAYFMLMDALDRRLLIVLQENGARTNQEISDIVGISASQVSRRRHALDEAGLITGYGARLSAEKLGFGIRVFVHVTLAAHSPDNSQRFADLVMRTPDILEAHALTGDSDYLLKVVVRSLGDLSALINNVLLPHQSVDRVRSEIVLETMKESGALPL